MHNNYTYREKEGNSLALSSLFWWLKLDLWNTTEQWKNICDSGACNQRIINMGTRKKRGQKNGERKTTGDLRQTTRQRWDSDMLWIMQMIWSANQKLFQKIKSKIHWDIEIQTNQSIQARTLGLIIVNKEKVC